MEARKRVLVADDNAAIRHVLVMQLRRLGYEAVAVEDGAGALAMLGERTFDLLITDLSMPGLAGIETITAVRRAFPALAVIAMSGGGGSEERSLNEARRQGADLVVSKPFTTAEFAAAVTEALARCERPA